MFFLLCVVTPINTIYFFEKAIPLRVPLLVLSALLVLYVAFWVKPDVFERLQRAGQLLLQAIAVAGVILFAEMLWSGFQARHLSDPPHAPEALVLVPNTAVRHHRVFWVILDELAFREAFEQHPLGVGLPAFDALKAQSIVFNNTVPAGNDTEFAVPSLITGQRVLKTRYSADGQNVQINTQDAGWTSFQVDDTIFADAQSLGYHSAIVGWYLPYCRILGGAFSYCFWTGHTTFTSIWPSDKIAVNMIVPVINPGGKEPLVHLDDFQDLKEASGRILRSNQYDFVYFHMPIPHPPGIYDRNSKTYATNHHSYVDNLVLADTYMAYIRQVLEAQGEWDDAAILLMGTIRGGYMAGRARAYGRLKMSWPVTVALILGQPICLRCRTSRRALW